ncbi:MAG: hypothetical protein QOE92_1317 [Chloroflexota bacterium]|jgi:DNA-directed RNA polymerase specialized sigma subunit|nr:hypothetical protein [Chloroflexota bacterium]
MTQARGSSPPDSDWLLQSIDQAEAAAVAAREALDAAVQWLSATRIERLAGVSILTVADTTLAGSGDEARLQASVAMEEYEHAVMLFRRGMVRALVDEGGLSLTEVARRMGVSRQGVARLYDASGDVAD